MSGLLGLLGLGARSGQLVIGTDGVRRALQSGEVVCVVLAADASPRAVQKVRGLAEARGVPVLPGPSADTLGARLGRPPVMAVGVRGGTLARGIMAHGTS